MTWLTQSNRLQIHEKCKEWVFRFNVLTLEAAMTLNRRHQWRLGQHDGRRLALACLRHCQGCRLAGRSRCHSTHVPFGPRGEWQSGHMKHEMLVTNKDGRKIMAEGQEINSKWSGLCTSNWINQIDPTSVWSLLIPFPMVGGAPCSNTIDIDYTGVSWMICSIFTHLIIYTPPENQDNHPKLVAGKQPLLSTTLFGSFWYGLFSIARLVFWVLFFWTTAPSPWFVVPGDLGVGILRPAVQPDARGQDLSACLRWSKLEVRQRPADGVLKFGNQGWGNS